MANEKRSKITNIVLVVLAVIVLCFCVYLVMSHEGESASNITVLKDMDDTTRLVGDKTDVYNNDDGTVLIKGDKPTNYMEPSDIFKDKPAPEIKDNTNGRHQSSFTGNPNVGTLTMGEEIVIEEVIEEEYVVDTSITLEEALLVLRNTRNKGATLVSRGITIHNYDWRSTTLSDIASENGLIFVPFNLSNTKQLDNLEKWSSVYDTYSGDINIVFLNTSYFVVDSKEKMKEEFENRKINPDIPIYFDNEGEIGMLVKGLDNVGYFVLNRDSFVYKVGALGSDVSNIRNEIIELNKIMSEFIVQEQLIIQKHGEGLIRKYEHVKMALDGTLDEYWANLEAETEAEESQTE